MLTIKFWKVPKITCPYYRFEAVIQDNRTVAQEVLCPAYLPPTDRQLPPDEVVLAPGRRFESSGSSYVLTRERLQAESRLGTWLYPIHLSVPENTTLYSSVLFDFLAADFRLSLTGPSISLVRGVADYTDDRASHLNFQNSISMALPAAGDYSLTLMFRVSGSATELANFCHQFAFSLTLSRSAGLPSHRSCSPG